MVTLTILLLISILISVSAYIDLSNQIKAYERKETRQGEVIPQTTPVTKKNNKMASKRSTGKSKGSGSKGKKNIKSNKSRS